MNIKNWFSKLGKNTINQVDDTIVSSIMNNTRNVVDDILKAAKSSDDVLRNLSGTLKSNQTYRNIYSEAVEEASRVKYGKTFDDLKNSAPNDAKALAQDIHKNLSQDVTDYLTVRQRTANAKYGSNKQANDKLLKNKNASSVDLNRSKTFLEQSIENKKIIDEFKKVFDGLPTSTYDDILEIIGKPITQNVTNTSGSGKNIIKYILPKKKYAILIGLGITGAAIWALYSNFAGNNDFNINDEDGKPIPIDSDAPTCLLELLKNNEASIESLSDGSKVIKAITSEYPSGLNFYNNGRVKDVATGKMGNYSCKSGMPTVTNESKNLSLYNLYLEAVESNEIDLNTMSEYVDDAVNDLDGYVAVYNLKSLKNILTQLSGKTYKGQNAITAFLEFYKEDEGGDDFISDVESVGTKTLGVEGMELKKEVLQLAKGGGTTTTTTSGEKVGIKNINIVWDKSGKSDGGRDDGKKTKVPYHDCSNKTDNFEYGCISPMIAEIQKCKGITPTKGYFGPKTKRTLGVSVITKKLYDEIISQCDRPVIDRRTSSRIQPVSPTSGNNRISSDANVDSSKLKPISQSNELSNKQLFDGLKSNKNFNGDIGDNRIVYRGPDLGDNNQKKLNDYLSKNGYRFYRERDPENINKEIIVWKKI